MGDFDRVAPGDKIKSHMTSNWFNATLPKIERNENGEIGKTAPRHDVRYAVCDNQIGAVVRYKAVRVLDLPTLEEPWEQYIPRITSGGITNCNFIITQEDTLPDKLCLVIVDGYTRAVVTILDSSHKFVRFNTTSGELESTEYATKAAMIVPGNGTDPSLIHLGIEPPFYRIPYLRFTSTSKAVNRVFNATVTASSSVPNAVGACAGLKRGDSVVINDPTNLFPEVEIGSTGSAYWKNGEDRWEVETATIPVNEILGKLTECLHYGDISATVKFGSAQGVPNFIGSTYPNRDLPPEVTENASDDYTVTADNPCKFDAVKDVNVVIRRRTDAPLSEADNLTVPKAKSVTGGTWEIVKVFEQFARWAKFTKNSSTFDLVSTWEGADPTPCGAPTLTCAFNCGCLDDGDEIIGFYDPVGDQYIGISTTSALLGPPDAIDFLVGTLIFDGDSCSIVYQQQNIFAFPCGSTSSPSSLALPLASINSLDNLFVSGSRICAITTSFQVVACAGGSGNVFCVDICPILCLCEELYSLPDVCDPPPLPECGCCDCLFLEGVTAVQITWSGETLGTTDITKLPLIGECSWLATFTDELGGDPRPWNIHLTCDGSVLTWSASGAWPGSTNNGQAMSLAGPGDCTGTSALVGTGAPFLDATGSISTDGDIVPCEPLGCCEVWSGDEEVTEFTGSNFGDWDIVLVAGSYPIVGNGCNATATLLCRVTNALFGGEFCDVTVELTLQYDFNINGDPAEEGCRWHYTIPECILQGGEPFPGDKAPGGAIFDCLTGGCAGANGTCGSFLAVTLQINDPDGSVISCTDPNA